MKILVFILTSLALHSTLLASPNTKSLENYWKETGLKANILADYITTKNCNRDLAHFNGCMNGLSKLGHFAKPELLVAADTENVPADQRLTKTFGALRVYKPTPGAQTPPQESKVEQKNRLAKRVEEWASLFYSSSRAGKPVAFSKALLWITSQALEAARNDEPVFVGETINSYLSLTFDPHTRILPSAYIDSTEDEERNVTLKTMTDHGDIVGVINIQIFRRSTCAAVRDALLSLIFIKRAQALVLDLRDNPGGYVDEAVCVASLFLPPGTPVVFEKPFDDTKPTLPYLADDNDYTNAPMSVLLSSHSASASELVAGALQDHRRAYVVGERSFGKGTVQRVSTVKSNPLLKSLKTEARYYLPGDRTPQLEGITPDFAVNDPLKKDTEEIAREEDLFVNPLPHEGKSWQQPRPQDITYIERCITREGLASQKFQLRQGAVKAPDYQALVAEDIAWCELEFNRHRPEYRRQLIRSVF